MPKKDRRTDVAMKQVIRVMRNSIYHKVRAQNYVEMKRTHGEVILKNMARKVLNELGLPVTDHMVFVVACLSYPNDVIEDIDEFRCESVSAKYATDLV